MFQKHAHARRMCEPLYAARAEQHSEICDIECGACFLWASGVENALGCWANQVVPAARGSGRGSSTTSHYTQSTRLNVCPTLDVIGCIHHCVCTRAPFIPATYVCSRQQPKGFERITCAHANILRNSVPAGRRLISPSIIIMRNARQLND